METVNHHTFIYLLVKFKPQSTFRKKLLERATNYAFEGLWFESELSRHFLCGGYPGEDNSIIKQYLNSLITKY